MITTDTSLMEISKMEGVGDLPMTVRAKFAQALKAEASGDHQKAKDKLNEAIIEEKKRAKS